MRSKVELLMTDYEIPKETSNVTLSTTNNNSTRTNSSDEMESSDKAINEIQSCHQSPFEERNEVTTVTNDKLLPNNSLPKRKQLTASLSLPQLKRQSTADWCDYHSLECLPGVLDSEVVSGDTSEDKDDHGLFTVNSDEASEEWTKHRLVVSGAASDNKRDNTENSTTVVLIDQCPSQQKIENILKKL